MDRVTYRNRVLVDLLASPWSLIPGVGGISLLTLQWALSLGGEWLTFAGVASLLTAVGTVVTRWFLSGDEITREAFESLQGDLAKEQEQELDRLEARLRNDYDPRTEESLRLLRALYADFGDDAEWIPQIGAKAALEISTSVEKLFRESIASLERTLEIWDAAQKMRTRKGRNSLIDSREEILVEIDKNVAQLAKTLDGLRALRLKKGQEAKLGRIRQELKESLEVAYRVDDRLQNLEAELESTPIDRERE